MCIVLSCPSEAAARGEHEDPLELAKMTDVIDVSEALKRDAFTSSQFS
jgi:hypothetical protein